MNREAPHAQERQRFPSGLAGTWGRIPLSHTLWVLIHPGLVRLLSTPSNQAWLPVLFILNFYYYTFAVHDDYIYRGELVHEHNTTQCFLCLLLLAPLSFPLSLGLLPFCKTIFPFPIIRLLATAPSHPCCAFRHAIEPPQVWLSSVDEH